MNHATPAVTPAELAEVIDLMRAVLVKLDAYALGLPASYVQLAVDHLLRAGAL